MPTTNKKNLLISGESGNTLNRVFESTSADNNDRYVFTGCFTQCSSKKPGGKIIMNRNKRIYYDDEVLRHLGYLRDQIKENGFLGGELDHPDRFEVRLSECSHKIVDLWYDQKSQQVRGKLELLDTPKGMIARQLVDAGLKLAVSSRSAGSVRNDSSVALDMMYTWDIVLTPGFEEAHLERVAESLQTEGARNFLNESISRHSLISDNDIIEVAKPAKINEKAQKALKQTIDYSALSRPLNESDEKKEEKKEEPTTVLPTANVNPLEEDGNDDQNSDTDNKESKDESKKDDKEEKDQNKDNDNDKNDDAPLTDEQKKERRSKILSIEAIPKGEDDKPSKEEIEERRKKIINIEGIEKEDDEKDDSAEKESKDDNKDENPEDDKTNECETNEDEESENKENEDELPSDMKTKDAKSTKEFQKKVLNDCDNKCKDVKEKTKADMKSIDVLLKKAKKMKEVKESICAVYPFAISLSESNFAKFAALQTKDKNKVQKFIVDNCIMDVRSINEHWMTPLIEEKRNEKNWLRLASDEDRKLFTEASHEVQEAIEESAKYMIIQNKRDADEFWEKTGLRQAHAQKLLNESLAAQYSIQTKSQIESDQLSAQQAAALGYSMNYFKMLEDAY